MQKPACIVQPEPIYAAVLAMPCCTASCAYRCTAAPRRYYKDELAFFSCCERDNGRRCPLGCLSVCGTNGQATGEPLLQSDYPSTGQYAAALQYIGARHAASGDAQHSADVLAQVRVEVCRHWRSYSMVRAMATAMLQADRQAPL